MNKAKMFKIKNGDHVHPDGWQIGGNLVDGKGFSSFRLETNNGFITSLAVEIKVTGRKIDRNGYLRCRITFVGDGEPNTFTGGKILIRELNQYLKRRSL